MKTEVNQNSLEFIRRTFADSLKMKMKKVLLYSLRIIPVFQYFLVEFSRYIHSFFYEEVIIKENTSL